MTDINPSLFWQFSCAFYRTSHVKNACLFLQDQHQIHVNLLLLCFYLDQQLIGYDQKCLQKLHYFSEAIERRYFRSFREKRYRAKNTKKYAPLLAAEIKAEEKMQHKLLSILRKNHKGNHRGNHRRNHRNNTPNATHSSTWVWNYLHASSVCDEKIKSITASFSQAFASLPFSP